MTAEGPRFGATPQNPDLLRWIGIQVVLLVIAWVIGNSTRRLEVADAVQYVAARWPETVRVSPLNRARLFFTLRRHRDTPTRLPRVVERVLTERAKRGVGSSEGE